MNGVILPGPHAVRSGLWGGGPAPFTPLSLSPVLWLKADVGTWQDSGLTTPAVADGDPVGGWADQSGNGNHVVQATSTKRPLLKLAIQNALPTIRFDGVDDFLRATFTLNQPFTAFLVARRLNTPGLQSDLFGGVSGDARLLYTAASNAVEAYATSAVSPVVSATVGSWHEYTAIFNRSSGLIGVDQADTSASTDIGNANPGGITVAARTDGAENSNQDVGELLAYAGSMSQPNRRLVEAYLKTRWGTP